MLVFVALTAGLVSAQPSFDPNQQPQGDAGVAKATEILNKYKQYFSYYQAITSGKVGGLIFNQFFNLAMKDADPHTQTTITFLQTIKDMLPKNVQGRPPRNIDRQRAIKKLRETEEVG